MDSHQRNLVSAVVDDDNPMWPSIVEVRTGRCPTDAEPPGRVYRLIGAPRGSSLYWDQPLAVAACVLSERIDRPAHARSVADYIGAFLDRCVAPDGMFRWGNHVYYDVFRDEVVEFHGGPHELRPITPAWDAFWRHAPERTERYIRTMADRHIYDPATGGFNRHDDGKKGHAFIEAGGILAESLAWLFAMTGDGDLLETALRIARYSYSHRDPATGLVPNEPDAGRWDSKVCTSEIGLWAQCLLRAAQYTEDDRFTEMARSASRSYLEHAYDVDSWRYVGQVAVENGRAVMPRESGYWPREYSDPWNTDQWPTHDYPLALAEASLSLYLLSKDDFFVDAARRWARIAFADRPARTGNRAYAMNYGRCIHFLARAGRELSEERLLDQAARLAEEAVECLYENGMFQGYPGTHLHRAVDGVGYLFLAFLALEEGEEPHMMNFRF
jgi:hypothetical protein